MNPMDNTKETVTFRAVSHDEKGQNRVEKIETDTHNVDTLKHIHKKHVDKGVQRQDRHPVDGIARFKQPKSGHGGKYTWEGPTEEAANELDPAPAAIDDGDPNYVDEEAEERVLRGEGMVMGKVEVAKLAEEGVARIDVDPNLQAQING